MRPSPKSIFLGIVALGLPIVVTAGWLLGTPESPSTSPGHGGATGFGTAPVSGISWGPAGQTFAPVAPRPVAVQTRVPGTRDRGARSARPSATAHDRAKPTGTVRPVPSSTEATPAPTEAPTPPPATVDPAPPK